MSGYTYDGSPVTAEDLKAAGAMAVLLRDALKPNLLQTLEHTPVLVHTGPFGNIATGNSSVVADRVGARMGDYLVTEAGFGSDMGMERFFNVKCRVSGVYPRAAVIVTTVRALKMHSGRFKVVAGKPLPWEACEDVDAVLAGAENLRKHIAIVRSFGVTPVVAINAFDRPRLRARRDRRGRRRGRGQVRGRHLCRPWRRRGGRSRRPCHRGVRAAVEARTPTTWTTR